MLEPLLQDMRREFPLFVIVKKSESNLMKAISVFLRLISFGMLNQFMTSYITTLGTTVYVPAMWSSRTSETSQVSVLRHERVHMRQAKRYGSLLFSLLYLFVFLPGGLAYFRAKFEKEAYEETIRATIELRGRSVLDEPAFKENIIKQFTGAAYLFMWPFRGSMERWYAEAVKRAEQER